MIMNRFLKAFLLLALVGAARADDTRPNVLFLFADDQRADTIAAAGNSIIRTPNLDRLAREGVLFNRAYMQGGMNGATCVPSRAMLLSGRNLFHISEKLEHDGVFDDTWPAAFGRAGYTTFITGKWHNGPPSLSHSFQMARSVFVGGMGNPLHLQLRDLVDGRLTDPRTGTKHSCAIFADETIRFLEDHRNGPFFAYVAFDAPHDPHIVPPDFKLEYDPATIPLPSSFLPVHPWNNGEMTVRDEKLLPWPRTPMAVKGMLADYYRYITYLDSQIGRILDALAESKYATNTIVVFSADSGVARGSHGLIGKQNLYELDSVRVPLIIKGPGIPAGKRTDAMCYLFDVLPTIGKICGIPSPAGSEGRDFGSSLHDPDHPARKEMMFAYKNLQRAYCDERWKLIRYPQVDKTQLFDLENDPQEATNLATVPAYAPKVTQLIKRLEAEQIESGDKAPLNIANPKNGDWTPPSSPQQPRQPGQKAHGETTSVTLEWLSKPDPSPVSTQG